MAALSPLLLRESRAAAGQRRFDVAGAVTITAALVALVYAVVEAPDAGWGDAQTLGLLALAAVLTAVFVAIESRSVAPLAPLRVFRSRALVGGNLVLFALGTMAFGVPFILTQYAQDVLGWSPIHFGLASVVMPVTAVIGTATAQAIATKGGVRRVAVVAMALTGLGSLLLTQVSVGGSYLGDLFFALLLLGPGIGAAYVAGSIASLTGVAETEAGLASGLNNASFQIGGAVGVAILSTVAVSGAHGAASPAALTDGYQSAFAVAIAVAALGVVAAGLLLGTRSERERSPSPSPTARPSPRSRRPPPDTVHLMVNDPFRALSHPIRRGIVERLAAGPATVGEATGGFGVSKPAISKHLKVLEETGVVTRVVVGRTHRLSLEPDVLSVAADWMDHQRALWGRLFDVVDEYLKEKESQ